MTTRPGGSRLWLLATFWFGSAAVAADARLTIDQGHLWRPPFGLQRVGAPFQVLVEIAMPTPSATYRLIGRRGNRQVFEQRLRVPAQGRLANRYTLENNPTELVLMRDDAPNVSVELARATVKLPKLEVAAEAYAQTVVNPVDLGAILPPADWLLLGRDDSALVDVDVLSRDRDLELVTATAQFRSDAKSTVAAPITLRPGTRATTRLLLPMPGGVAPTDTLRVRLIDEDERELWRRDIPVMLVRKSPRWPAFGATETKLRYDAPISVRNADGSFGKLDYAAAWDPSLHDVVVSLPNGARFVFWRGASYVPFWAGKYNTGLSYEWAETSPPKDGFTDCVEPLMDKELRYGRVEIVENTAARVHVRWTYQSCDFLYKVWGDSAQEDFVFYRDGFGTRTLTLNSKLDADYELSELIILTPAATYPLRVLPERAVDILYLDGGKREPRLPFDAAAQPEVMKPRGGPMLFRARHHQEDPLAAVYFHPTETRMPPVFFAPFSDQGEIVTPCYWGSHWPLARGQTTGGAINDRVGVTPCHNSLLTWARIRPEPLRTARFIAPDTLGRTGPRLSQTWTWLIGASDADDARLLQWAASFGHPPSIAAKGARLEADSYALERRALRLIVEQDDVKFALTPAPVCVNPVFELRAAPPQLAAVSFNDAPLGADRYAWDGRTLWLDATFKQPVTVKLSFKK